MDKDILIRYSDLKQDIKLLRRQIDADEKALRKMESEGCVGDVVRGGMGGIQHFKIRGFPTPEYNRRMAKYRKRCERLRDRECELLDVQTQAEEYLDTLDYIMRDILTLYLIDGLTYRRIAERMNASHHPKKEFTEESIRKRISRFFE